MWDSFNNGNRCPICYKLSRKRNYDLSKFKEYKTRVEILTRKNYNKFKWLINPLKLPKAQYKYQVDHIYSMADGFENNILPEVLSSPVNLRMMWWSDNDSKDRRSDFSLDQLYNLHTQFLKEN